MFSAAGDFPVTIKQAITSPPKWSKAPNAFDICLEVVAEDGQSDWYHLEMSNAYGTGTYKGI